MFTMSTEATVGRQEYFTLLDVSLLHKPNIIMQFSI